MKKILSLFLAILMSLSVASMIGAAEEAAIVDEATPELIATKEDTSIYDEAIQYLTEYGILHGKEDGLPHAEDAIKRYEMALFVARISTGWVDDAQWKVWWVGSDATVAEEWYDREHDVTGFTDLEGSGAANFLGALSYASQKGIILGYGDGKFGPEDGIRYEDALTMLCRVLEYNNLEWPWGYIEKAVNLGLTKGIPSTVAYRDRLNRGEVAQLIYNALFADMKNGGTLASRYFNGALEWKNIIITGAGYGRLLPNDLLTDKGALYDLGDYIAFRIVDEKDGSLDASKTYFVNNKDLNWLDKRYERYLGYAYKALFTVDEKGYATLYHVKDLKGETVKNRGRLAKVDDAYPIDTFLKGKTLVSKFTLKGTYLNNYNEKYNPSLNEFILRNALQVPPQDDNQSVKIAVQWNSGNNNIVEYEYLKDGDGNVVKDAAGNPVVDKTKVNTIWYWNSDLRVYFSVLFDKDGNYYGIKLLDEDEVAKLLAKMNKHEYKGGLNIIAPDKPGTTAYADLTPFKLLGASDYNYGLYEQYALGQYKTVTDAKDADGKDKPGFKVDGLNSLGSYYWDYKYNDKFELKDAYSSSYANAVVDKTPTEGAGILGWINDKEGVVPADGDYIIYSFDPATKELKVVKIINEKTFDENNYIGSGVLRGWKLADKKFNIDGTDYYFDYNELLGNGLKFHGGDALAVIEQNAFTNFFRGLFNQYVKFLVVDGKVVHMWKSGYTNDIIVVDSYAGLSSDGYIVVNGYNTADLKYAQFKIGSYNGWVKGDYFYYPDNATVDAAFARGTIYKLTSIDKSGKDPIYYVYTIAQPVRPREAIYPDNMLKGPVIPTKYDFGNLDSAYVDDGVYPIEGWTIELDGGYKQITKDGKTLDGKDAVWEKANSSDKYIFICNVEGNDWAPIIVYQGKGGDGWYAQGTLVNGKGSNDPHVVVNAKVGTVAKDGSIDYSQPNKAFYADEWEITYVLFQRYNYDFGAYDSTYAGDWYLLGASNFTAKCLNIYTGKEEDYIAVNKQLKKGYAYPAMNGQIVNDEPYDAEDLGYEIDPVYGNIIKEAYRTNKKYIFGSDFVGSYNLFDKEKFSAEVLSKNPAYKVSDKVNAKGGAKDLATDTIVILLDVDHDTDRILNWQQINKDQFAAAFKGKNLDTVYFWYISTVGGSTVIYIENGGKAAMKTGEEVIDTKLMFDVTVTHELTNAPIPAYLVPSIGYKKEATSATINGLGLRFEGLGTKDTHRNVAEHALYFGESGFCNLEGMEAAVNNEPVVGAIHSEWYAPHADEHDKSSCDRIKGIFLEGFTPVKIPVPVWKWDTDKDGKVLTTGAWYDNKDATTPIADENIKYDYTKGTVTVTGDWRGLTLTLADDVIAAVTKVGYDARIVATYEITNKGYVLLDYSIDTWIEGTSEIRGAAGNIIAYNADLVK
jgi:hypothetical protein